MTNFSKTVFEAQATVVENQFVGLKIQQVHKTKLPMHICHRS